jgi:hypothetical protein
MSNLPQLAQLEIGTDEVTDQVETEDVHATFDWDFTKGDFKLKDGKLVRLTGVEYLKVWIQKALRTVKDSLIYKGTDYGSGHHSLIGTTFKPSFTKEEYKRYIKEALLSNSAITNVSNFTFSQTGSRMVIGFDVTSIYGVTGEDVVI